MTDLANIPAPLDAVHVDEWEPVKNAYRDGCQHRRWFSAGHYHIPAADDPHADYDAGETILFVDGFQEDDGESHRHIKVFIRDEDDDEAVEVARYLPGEARRVALRLLMAAEEIDEAETYPRHDDDETTP
jgi:hypothetical protein